MAFAERNRFTWQLRTLSLALGERTLVMGIVNATPDSFSDGAAYDPVTQGLRLMDEGADILDIGGESTRPGGEGEVNADEEQRRVLPVISALVKAGALVSVDTYRASTARLAVESGAEIANDVSGMLWDREMASTCAELQCGVVVMHTRGKPKEWQSLPPVSNVAEMVLRELRERLESALTAGIAKEHVVLDPGFGFGKRGLDNFALLREFSLLNELQMPLLAGLSRKGFLGGDIIDREYATVGVHTAAILAGAHIIRTHDVKAGVQGARVADQILNN